MARQNVMGNSSQRELESYTDFAGGLNSEISSEKLKNNEFPVMQNGDILSRGSYKRRTGRVKVLGITGTAQGMFHYYREGQTAPDIILAVSGKLYLKRNGETTATEMPITYSGAPFIFQDELPVEAVQYRTDMFVATGTKIVEINYDSVTDTFTAGILAPYKPTVQEVINIGTNALASDPATWIQEKDNPVVEIEGITASSPQGAVNTAITFTAHVKKPVNVDVHYSFSYRKTGAGSYTYVKTDSADNFTDLTINEVGGYDIKAETKKVTYVVNNADASWTGAQAGITQRAGNNLDGVDGTHPSLVLTTNGGTVVSTQDIVWYDFPTPFDMSKADTLDWWWTQYGSDNSGGTIAAGTVKLRFYTQGNLTTPLFSIDSTLGHGRGLGGTWSHEISTYDNSLTGMDQIVRVAVYGIGAQGTYVPNTTFSISGTDTSARIDNIVMYEAGTETSYTLTNYEIVGVLDPNKDPATYEAIHSSRMIRLHYNKLLLGKDSKYPGQLYLSYAFNPRYFPSTAVMDFSLDRREPVTEVVRYQDFLVVFTKSTISSVVGQVTSEMTVNLINDHTGCIADRSAKVTGNNIVFLSQEGVMMLKPNMYKLEQMNVQRVDYPIKSEITPDTNACAMVYDNQYWLCFPDKTTIYRLDYNKGVWIKDVSTKLNLSQFLVYGTDVFNLSTDGILYKHDISVFTDDGEAYTLLVETKQLDLSATINNKKLRMIYVMAKSFDDHAVDLSVRVYADAQMVLGPDSFEVVIDPNTRETSIVDTSQPNFSYRSSTTLGSWVLGESKLGNVSLEIQKAAISSRKCRRVSVSFEHKESTACEIFGFGLEFRILKP